MPFFTVKKRISRRYRFILCDSNLHGDTIGTPIRELRKAKGRSFTKTLNRGGNLSLTVPLDDPSARDIIGHEIRRCILVILKDSDYDDEIVVGSWPIMNVSASTDSGRVNVQCVGWQELLGNREFMRQAIYADIYPGEIVRRMLSSAKVQIFDESVDMTANRGDMENASDFFGMPGVRVGNGNIPDASYEIPSVSTEWSKSGAASAKVNVRTGFAGVGSDASTYNLIAARYGVYLTSKGLAPGITLPSGTSGGDATSLAVPIDPLLNRPYSRLVVSFHTKTVALRNVPVYVTVQGMASGTGASTGAMVPYDITSLMPTDGKEGKVVLSIDVPQNAPRVLIQIGLNSTITQTNAEWVGYIDAARVYPDLDSARNRAEEMGIPFEVGTGIDLVGGPVRRTRTFAVGQKLDAAIQELSDIEAGFDYEIITEEVVVAGDSQQRSYFRRRFILKWDLIKPNASLYGIGQDRPNTIFAQKWGPRNVLDITETIDGSKMANRIIVRDPNGRAFVAQDEDSIREYGLFQDTLTISDAGYADNVLQAYAGAELAYRRVPFTTYTVKPKSFMGARNVPRIFRDYDVGDICYLVSREESLMIGVSQPQAIRVFGVTVALDEEGNETIQNLQTTATS